MSDTDLLVRAVDAGSPGAAEAAWRHAPGKRSANTAVFR